MTSKWNEAPFESIQNRSWVDGVDARRSVKHIQRRRILGEFWVHMFDKKIRSREETCPPVRQRSNKGVVNKPSNGIDKTNHHSKELTHGHKKRNRNQLLFSWIARTDGIDYHCGLRGCNAPRHRPRSNSQLDTSPGFNATPYVCVGDASEVWCGRTTVRFRASSLLCEKKKRDLNRDPKTLIMELRVPVRSFARPQVRRDECGRDFFQPHVPTQKKTAQTTSTTRPQPTQLPTQDGANSLCTLTQDALAISKALPLHDQTLPHLKPTCYRCRILVHFSFSRQFRSPCKHGQCACSVPSLQTSTTTVLHCSSTFSRASTSRQPSQHPAQDMAASMRFKGTSSWEATAQLPG